VSEFQQLGKGRIGTQKNLYLASHPISQHPEARGWGVELCWVGGKPGRAPVRGVFDGQCGRGKEKQNHNIWSKGEKQKEKKLETQGFEVKN